MRWIVVLFLVLSACTSAEDERRHAQERAKARQAAHHAKCLEYGFKRGTPEYAKCRQDFDLADKQAEDRKRAAVLRHLLGR